MDEFILHYLLSLALYVYIAILLLIEKSYVDILSILPTDIHINDHLIQEKLNLLDSNHHIILSKKLLDVINAYEQALEESQGSDE